MALNKTIRCPWCSSLNLTLKDQWYCNDCDWHWLNMLEDAALTVEHHGDLYEGSDNEVRAMVRNMATDIREMANENRSLRVPRTRRPLVVDCNDCDGCGWVEGGETLQTTCKTCKGAGVLTQERPCLK